MKRCDHRKSEGPGEAVSSAGTACPVPLRSLPPAPVTLASALQAAALAGIAVVLLSRDEDRHV